MNLTIHLEPIYLLLRDICLSAFSIFLLLALKRNYWRLRSLHCVGVRVISRDGRYIGACIVRESRGKIFVYGAHLVTLGITTPVEVKVANRRRAHTTLLARESWVYLGTGARYTTLDKVRKKCTQGRSIRIASWRLSTPFLFSVQLSLLSACMHFWGSLALPMKSLRRTMVK